VNSAGESGGEPHLSDDQLVDLLHDFLDETGRAVALAHASACPVCDARLRECARVHERGRASAAAMLASTPRDGVGFAPLPGPHSGMPRRLAHMHWRRSYPALLAAAGLIVVAGIGVNLRPTFKSSARHAPPAAGASHVWLPSAQRSGQLRAFADARVDSLVLAGIAAYERRELGMAESLLSIHPAQGELEWVRRLYLANTFVALERPSEALPLLEVWESGFLPEPWDGEWRWTYLVALERSGQRDRSDSLLVILRARTDEIGARARVLTDDPRRRR
jgi:hypothetical protein